MCVYTSFIATWHSSLMTIYILVSPFIQSAIEHTAGFCEPFCCYRIYSWFDVDDWFNTHRLSFKLLHFAISSILFLLKRNLYRYFAINLIEKSNCILKIRRSNMFLYSSYVFLIYSDAHDALGCMFTKTEKQTLPNIICFVLVINKSYLLYSSTSSWCLH